MSNGASELLNAIGATAEMLGIFQRELLKNGFDRKEALVLCKTYLEATLTAGSRNKQDEE